MSDDCQCLTDTHCHLNHSDFDSDCDEVIGRAREAGVKRMLVIGFDLESSRRALNLAGACTGMQASIGIHPELAHEWTDAARSELIAMAQCAPGVIAAWGEVGLDYHWESVPRDAQRRVFSDQIAIASGLHLPLVVHCRDAYGDVLDILSDHKGARAVLHCFTGSREEAARAVQAGYYLGVGGIATFKKNDELRDIIKATPLESILLETDSPYLAPQARRGKRNEPAYISLIAEAIAPLLGLSVADLARVTTENAVRLFGRMRANYNIR